MRHIILNVIVCALFAGHAYAQQSWSADSSRLDIGGRFSITNPAERGWQAIGPSGYFKILKPEGHSLALSVRTAPSGITVEEFLAIDEADMVKQIGKLVAGFLQRSWKANTAVPGDRLELLDAANNTETIGKDFICARSRLRLRDRGALLDGIPSEMRVIVYSCIEFPDMIASVTVSYSERGRAQDFSDEAFAEGDQLIHSLQRQPLKR